MAELKDIVAELKRHRRDLDDSLVQQSTRSGEAADLVKRIGDLRERAEATQRKTMPRTPEK